MGPSMDDCAEDPLAPRSSPEGGALPVLQSAHQSRYKYCRLGRFVRTPLAGRSKRVAKISHVSSHLELPACLGCAARRPVSLVSDLWAFRVLCMHMLLK